jgi:hypothetical protein
MKNFFLFSLLALFIAGCGKNQQPRLGCGTGVCTLEFASVNILFTDNADKPVSVQNFSAINQRTGLKLEVNPANSMPGGAIGSYVIANDNTRDQLSDEGDNILVSGTYAGQTKTAVVKISGGCNCHVKRESGPSTIKFD